MSSFISYLLSDWIVLPFETFSEFLCSPVTQTKYLHMLQLTKWLFYIILKVDVGLEERIKRSVSASVLYFLIGINVDLFYLLHFLTRENINIKHQLFLSTLGSKIDIDQFFSRESFLFDIFSDFDNTKKTDDLKRDLFIFK